MSIESEMVKELHEEISRWGNIVGKLRVEKADLSAENRRLRAMVKLQEELQQPDAQAPPVKGKCPVCGSSDNLTSSTTKRMIPIPFVGEKVVEIRVEKCGSCGESGDFLSRNDPIIKAALCEADLEFIAQTMRWMDENHISVAYLQRVLSLPFSTLNTWKAGKFPPEAIALLRFIRTFPWLLAVAESGFKNSVAQRMIMTTAADLINKEFVKTWFPQLPEPHEPAPSPPCPLCGELPCQCLRRGATK